MSRGVKIAHGITFASVLHDIILCLSSFCNYSIRLCERNLYQSTAQL
jgi:hypothetical protein